MAHRVTVVERGMATRLSQIAWRTLQLNSSRPCRYIARLAQSGDSTSDIWLLEVRRFDTWHLHLLQSHWNSPDALLNCMDHRYFISKANINIKERPTTGIVPLPVPVLHVCSLYVLNMIPLPPLSFIDT